MNVYDLPDLYESDVNGLQAIMETGVKKGEDYRPMVLKIEKTTKLEERTVEIGSVEGLELWEENKSDAETSFEEGFETRWIQKEYSRRLPIGRHAQRFYMFDLGKLRTAAEKLGDAAYVSIQEISLEPISKAADATYVSGYTDGKRVASALHPIKPGSSSTYSNVLTGSPKLDYDSIKEAFARLDEMPDDRGKKLHLGKKGYTVWTTSWDDYLTALNLIDPKSERLPDSDANNANEIGGGTLRGVNRPVDVIYLPYAENATYTNLWGVLAKGEVFAKLKTVYDYETSRYKNDDTGTVYVRGSTMFSVKVVNPRVNIFSLGDNSTDVNW